MKRASVENSTPVKILWSSSPATAPPWATLVAVKELTEARETQRSPVA
jgi:hypothetical protein